MTPSEMGKKGAKMRFEKLSAERRSEIAKMGGLKKAENARKKMS